MSKQVDLIAFLIQQELLREPMLLIPPHKKGYIERILNRFGYYSRRELEFKVKEARVGVTKISVPKLGDFNA